MAQKCKKKKKNLVDRNGLHFPISTNSKPSESRLPTLLILPDRMKDY